MVTNTLETDLGALTEPFFNVDLQDNLVHPALASFIEQLPLDPHLFRRAMEQLLQRDRQRPLHSCNLGCGRPSAARAVRTTAECIAHSVCTERTPACTRPRPARAKSPPRGAAKEVVEDVGTAEGSTQYFLGITEGKTTTAGACREVEAGTARRAAHVEELEALGHAASEGMRASATSIWCRAAAQDELEAELIINFAFFWVREDLIGLRDLLELLGGLRVVLVLVWVPLQGSFPVGVLAVATEGNCGCTEEQMRKMRGCRKEQNIPVGLLDLILRGVGADIQQVVELCLFDHCCGSVR